MKKYLTIALLCIVVLQVSAATRIPLCDGWKWHRGFQGSDSRVELPHTWNQTDAMFGNTDYFRGLCCYSRELQLSEEASGKRIFLRVGAAQTIADVYVDNRFVMQHRGGYTAFCAELTDFLTIGKVHKLSIYVSNASTMEIAPICGDFNIFGGMNRGAELILTEPVCIAPDYYASDGVFATQHDVSEQSAQINIRSVISAIGETDLSAYSMRYEVSDNGRLVCVADNVTISDGEATAEVTIMKPHLWDGQHDPHLYNLTAQLLKDGSPIDSREIHIGLRYFHADAETGFWLNGHQHRLNGVNRHQDRAERASALTALDDAQDLDLIEEMGCNAVRFSHYPQSDNIISEMDRRGLVSWVEIPFVNVYVQNPMYQDNLRQQLTEMVMQYYNHPSVLAWGLFNEINSGWMERPSDMVIELNNLAHRLDPSRLTTGATNQKDDFNGTPDLIAHNKYYGWYSDVPEDMGAFLDSEHAAHPERTIGLSEYGAGASIWQQQDSLCRPDPWGHWHPENWQTYYHIENWRQIQARPWMWCNFIWCMFDFSAAPRREGPTPGRNDKGLVSYDRSERKDAFYFYKANWNQRDKFLYIAGRHNHIRHSQVIDIHVFSNCGPAELRVNGVCLGNGQPDEVNVISWKGVRLREGQNSIEVHNKKATDCIEINYQPQPLLPVKK